MINYGANYIGVDRDRYDAGNKFYSQDRFLQGVGLDKPAITFNEPDPNATGIMSQYPFPYPPIQPQSGGDGGIGPAPKAPTTLHGYDDVMFGKDVGGGGIGKTTYTDEEEKQRQLNNLKTLGRFALSGFNPLTLIMDRVLQYRRDNQEKKDRADKITADRAALANTRDMAESNRAAGTGGYQAGYSDDFMTGGDSQRDDAQEASSPGSSGPGGSDTMGSFAYGGIVGMYR
jgi:hypothetical protein